MTEAMTIPGAEGLPIDVRVDLPERSPRGRAIVVHGFTGHNRRNIVPVLGAGLAAAGLLVWRVTLGHAGIAPEGDEIADLDVFARDSLAHSVEDVLAACAAQRAALRDDLPILLAGHSRGGATILRCAAELDRRAGPALPAGLVSVAAPSAYTRVTPQTLEEVERRGFIERPVGRAPGGAVRMGRSWFEHHLDGTADIAEDCARVPCPVLLLHGTADNTVPAHHADRLAALLGASPRTAARLVRIQDGDHNLGAKGLWPDVETTAATDAGLRALAAFVDELLA